MPKKAQEAGKPGDIQFAGDTFVDKPSSDELIPGGDPVIGHAEARETGMTAKEAQLLEMIQNMNQRLTDLAAKNERLEAVADTHKLYHHDRANRDLSVKYGFLRAEDAADPIIWWKMTKNYVHADPQGRYEEDQRVEIKTLSGAMKEITLVEFAHIMGQTPIKFVSLNYAASKATIQISKDGGQTFTGEPMEIDLKYVN